MDNTTVTQIGKYEILGQIGEGGMGVVYRGEDKGIGRAVAIKTLKNATSELRQRFLVEAKTGALNHPNIVTVFEVGEQDGNPYIAMEYLEGGSLETMLRSGRSVPLVEKLDIIRQVCLGLGYAHQERVVHRDIKPANVMVNSKGQVKIVDFGIARLENTSGHTATGQVIGTVDYISPERIKGNRSDGRADIWSTGVMLYQLLTNNHLPFPGDDPTTKIYKIVNEPYEPLANLLTDYPPGLDHVLERSLAKDPNDRYESAEEMAGDIEEINEALKRARLGEMIVHVKRLIGQQQLVTAKQDLIGLQRLDPQNTEIKKLFREVSEQLARQQKSEQVRQLASQAEEAVLSQRYVEAIELYRQAAKVEPSEHGFTVKIEHIRGLKEKADKIASLLQQARDARHNHDYDRAADLIAQALPLDDRNTDLRNEQARIYQDAERAKKDEVKQRLTREGREQFAARHYTQAIEALGDALKIDPTDAEIQRMYQEAVALQEEQRRRTVVEKIVAEIEDCIYRSEIDRALALIQRALEKLPGETALLRLKAETEEKQREIAVQRLVEQTSLQVQSLLVTDPQEALACVQRARETMPGEPRLIALEEQIVQRLKRDNLAGLKAQYLKQAQGSIDARQYDQAIQILESAAIDCGEATDIAYLLDYARAEKSKEARRQVVAAALREAQESIGNGELEAAIRRLEPVAAETRDPAVEQLMRQTSANLAEVARRIDAVVERIEALSERDPPQALQLLLSQPQAIQQHSRMRAVRARLDTSSERDRLAREAIEQAEDCLAKKDLRRGLESLESIVHAYGDSPRLSAAIAEYKSRRVPIANGIVDASIKAARQSIVAQSAARALDDLQVAADALEFADSAVQADWNRLAQEAAKAAGTKRKSIGKMQIVVQSGRPSGLVIGLIAVAVIAVVGVVVWYSRRPGGTPSGSGTVVANPAPTDAHITVTTTPPGALVSIDGDAKGPTDASGVRNIQVDPATQHELKVTMNDYVLYTEKFMVGAGKTLRDPVVLTPLPTKNSGTLVIQGNLPTVKVVVNHHSLGLKKQGPLPLEAGSYTIQYSNEDGSDTGPEHPVLIAKGQSATDTFKLKSPLPPPPPPAQTGNLLVQTTPGASVSVDGQPKGTANQSGSLPAISLPVGQHRVDIALNNFGAISGHMVTITSGPPATLNLPLTPNAPTTGSVSFKTTPGAQVYLNTELKASADDSTGVVNLSNFNPGTYSLKITADGYQDHIGSIRFSAGTQTLDPMPLIPKPQPQQQQPQQQQQPPPSVDPAVELRKVNFQGIHEAIANFVAAYDKAYQSKTKANKNYNFEGLPASFVSSAKLKDLFDSDIDMAQIQEVPIGDPAITGNSATQQCAETVQVFKDTKNHRPIKNNVTLSFTKNGNKWTLTGRTSQ